MFKRIEDAKQLHTMWKNYFKWRMHNGNMKEKRYETVVATILENTE